MSVGAHVPVHTTSTNVQLVGFFLSTIAGIAALLTLFSKKLRKSRMWTVTVTPLASIIGSGFLIVAPIMYFYYKSLSLPLIILLNGLALLIGSAIRYNILNFDEVEEKWTKKYFVLQILELGSNLILGISYVIAVAFYASIMSSFIFELFGVNSAQTINGIPAKWFINALTTAVLAFVGLWGYKRGLHALESLEKVAVNIKMSVIVALLVALVSYVGFSLMGKTPVHYGLEWVKLTPESLAVLAGLLLITQGFETVKYMGDDYPAKLRVKAMLYAQIIAAVIYVIFVPLAGPISAIVSNHTETAIIDVLAQTSLGMGVLLSIAAIFSQFGAVVADTIGRGGLFEEVTGRKVNEKQAYVLSTTMALLLPWFFNIFEIVALASRFFAMYYLLQVIIAVIVSFKKKQFGRTFLYTLVAGILVLVVLFAKSSH